MQNSRFFNALCMTRAIFIQIFHRNVRLKWPSFLGKGTIWHAAGPVTAGNNFRAEHWVEIVAHNGATIKFGDNVFIGHSTKVSARHRITIGNDVLIGDLVTIRDHNHRYDLPDIPIRSQGMTSSPVIIGNNVWLCSKVTITPGVTIGDNCVIGANAVVTRNIPPNSFAAGVPARVQGAVPGCQQRSG